MDTTAQKVEFLDHHREELGGVSEGCRILKLPPSTYYHHQKTGPSKRDARDLVLKEEIDRVHSEFPTYGYRRLKHHLARAGMCVNEKRLRRVMRKYGLRPVFWKAFKVQTTQSDHDLPVFPNCLAGVVETGLNQVWVADLTYIHIGDGFVYLAAILDRFSRKAIGWAISKRLDRGISLAALEMALENRNPPPGCIHHTDRGVQYACWEYVERLREKGFQISMSRTGNPYDNAYAESFFKTLKYEEVHLQNYESFEEVLEKLPKFIEEVYNRKRLHSGIGYLPPEEFEKNLTDPVQNIAVRPILCLD
jgi:putative transposase